MLFNFAALVSTRWMATAAHAGSGSLSLWVLAATFFLVPSAFAVAHLSRKFPGTRRPLYLDSRSFRGVAWVCLRLVLLRQQLFWIPGVLIATVGMVASSFPAARNVRGRPRYVLPGAMLFWC